MFLFEEFTYDEEWAKKNYGESFIHNNWYLDGIINDYKFKASLPKEDIERFNFSVSRYTGIPDVKNLYKISYAVHYAWKPDEPFKQDQIDYLTNKLSILGDAVKIIVPHYEATMIIQYFIEKDEYRWNREQAKVKAREEAENEIVIPEPSEKSWLEMIDAFTYAKNPRIIFKKVKTLNELLEKLIIAYKLKWPGAVNGIHSQLIKFLKTDSANQNNPYDNTKRVAFRYAQKYEIPEYIQELLDDLSIGSKNIGAIPTKGKHIAEKLDTCDLVKKYSIKVYSDTIFMVINLQLTNGNEAHITISKPNLYLIRIYKDIEIKDRYVYPKYETKIGRDYFSLPNRNRSNHVLNDTFDAYFDYIINDIQNMKK